MSKGAIVTAKNDEWYTPKEIVAYFGKFDYDPATTEEKASDFGIRYFDTKETDGLIRDWTKFRKIWINPPFTRKKEFLEKAWNTYQRTGAVIYILLPVTYLTTKALFNVLGGALIYLPNGRINFEDIAGQKKKGGAVNGSCILKLANSWSVEPLKLEKIYGE